MPVTVKTRQQGGARVAKRAMDRAIRTALGVAIVYWHETYLPDHFTVAGGKRYGYKPRKGDGEPPTKPVRQVTGRQAYVRTKSNNAYSWRKRRTQGHNKPLVWEGDSEKAATAGIRLSTRRVAAEELIRGVGVMDVPKYFYQYRKDLDQPDKVDELTRTLPEEQARLHRVFEQSIAVTLSASTAPTDVQNLSNN